MCLTRGPPSIKRENPHKAAWNSMRLYLLSQVEAVAAAKHGGLDELEDRRRSLSLCASERRIAKKRDGEALAQAKEKRIQVQTHPKLRQCSDSIVRIARNTRSAASCQGLSCLWLRLQRLQDKLCAEVEADLSQGAMDSQGGSSGAIMRTYQNGMQVELEEI